MLMATSVTTSEMVPPTAQEPVFVPGYGWVQWSRPLLDAQARYLLLLHRPEQQWGKFRLVSGRRLAEGSRCLYCGREWICPEAVWANAWLSPLSRVWSRQQKSRGGRHRAPGAARVGSSPRGIGGRRVVRTAEPAAKAG
jgi:hypothetical protein